MRKYGIICVAICIVLVTLISFSGCSSEIDPLSITFDTQNGTTTDSLTKSVAYGSTYGDLPTVEREGYIFDGWWTGTGSESIRVTSSSEVTVSGELTLYAKWTLTYTVTFDTQEGAPTSPETMEVTYGSSYGYLPIVEREGYTFAGWWTGTDSESTQVTSSSEVTVTSDQILYAKWTANTYTITFDTQGGETSDFTWTRVTYGWPYGNFPTVERKEYTFCGWCTGTDSESTQVTSSSVVKVTGDQTLYAKWILTVVGSIGPAGGYVFYDKGSYGYDGWRYLEAAPSLWYEGETDSSGDDDPSIQWGACGYTVDPSATDTAVGTGYDNTENIVFYHNSLGNIYSAKGDYYTNPTYYYSGNDGTVAAKVCSEYSVENEGTRYDDWFLPSEEELDYMHDNLFVNGLAGFSGYYWSSSEINGVYARLQVFSNGYHDCVDKNTKCRVRPVRAF
jgi:uncharacterized repeat protein (TIGR02543 family)